MFLAEINSIFIIIIIIIITVQHLQSIMYLDVPNDPFNEMTGL